MPVTDEGKCHVFGCIDWNLVYCDLLVSLKNPSVFSAPQLEVVVFAFPTPCLLVEQQLLWISYNDLTTYEITGSMGVGLG